MNMMYAMYIKDTRIQGYENTMDIWDDVNVAIATPDDEAKNEQDPMSKARRGYITNTALIDNPIYGRDAPRDEIERDEERDGDVIADR